MGPLHLFRFSLDQASLRAGEVSHILRSSAVRSFLAPSAQRKTKACDSLHRYGKNTAMKDTKFFERALELLAPWKVVDVNMDLAAKKVEVKVDCGKLETLRRPDAQKAPSTDYVCRPKEP